MKKKNTTTILTVGALLTASILPTVVSAAENDTKGEHTASLRLEQGEFTLQTSESLSFGSHKIEKAKKTVSTGFANDFYVTDERGTQEGWDVTVSATPFTIVEPAGGWVKENPYSLPLGSLTLDRVESVAGVYNERASIYPTLSDLGVAIDLGQEVNVSNAAKGKGMGKYAFTFGADALHLVIDPATAKIDKVNYPDTVTPYEATITWNLVSGPGTSTGTIESENESDTLNGDNSGNVGKDETTDNVNPYDEVANTEENIAKYNYTVQGDEVIINGIKEEYITDAELIIPSEIEGKKVTTIAAYAFDSNEYIVSIELPEGLKTIEDYAFSFAMGLVEITIPSTVTYISKGAFALSTPSIVTDKSGTITEKNKSSYFSKYNNVNVYNN